MNIYSIKKNYPDLYDEYVTIINMNSSMMKWKTSRVIYHIVNNVGNIPTCNCGNKLSFDCYKKGYRKYCSGGCSGKNNKLFGNRNPMKIKSVVDKVKKTKIKNGTLDITHKISDILLEKYGVSNPMHVKGALDKRKRTLLKKYGVDNPAKIQSVIDSRKKNDTKIFIKLLGKEYDLIEYNKIVKVRHTVCNRISDINRSTLLLRKSRYDSEYCVHCNPLHSNTSNCEKELLNFIKSIYKLDIISNSRKIIEPYEIDIYLPELNLAIEFNGLLFHSEYKVDKNYHIKKTNMCRNKNIQLIHIWEDDWLYKKDIVKSIISGHIGNNNKIYARKCNIKNLGVNDCREFINNSHIQGFVPATKYYGLHFEDELIQVMSFKRVKDNDWEISRLCSKLNTSVIGGASRIFKHFLNNNEFDSLISYSLNDYFDGGVYKNLGFEFVKETKPSYFYVVDRNRLSRQKFQKHKLIKDGYDKEKSGDQIMLERGYYKIYNSGNKIWNRQ